MMIPCIDLQDGRAVQLVHGRERKLAVDDVFGLLDRFGRHPLIHVIDLDAAMRKGRNARLVRELCAAAKKRKMRVRVGGGIRTVAQAARIAAWGAEKIIVGSAAFKDGRVNGTFPRPPGAQDWTAARHDRAGHRGRKNPGARLAG